MKISIALRRERGRGYYCREKRTNVFEPHNLLFSHRIAESELSQHQDALRENRRAFQEQFVLYEVIQGLIDFANAETSERISVSRR